MSYLGIGLGRTVRKAALGMVFSSFASLAFAWSISGNVSDEAGSPLAAVSINAMNISGVSTKTDIAGNFSISSESPQGFFGAAESKISVNKTGNLLSISNTRGGLVKVTLMDALGKVSLQQEFYSLNIRIDLTKYSNQKIMILRVSSIGSTDNYVITQKAIVKNSLRLEAASNMPLFSFSLDGYEMTAYQMAADVETDVKIVMKKATAISSSNSAESGNSSSSTVPNVSSSSEVSGETSSSDMSGVSSGSEPPVSSSSKVEDVVSCTEKTLKTDQQNYMVDGRKVIIQFPQGYDATKPAPLLINYHPISGSADGWSGQSQVAKVAKADGAIVAFMDGVADHKMMGFMLAQAWNVGPCCTDADDITYTKKFIEKISQESCIDTKRIYAAGFSMGGGMSNYVGCRMADVFAAAAPSAFDLAQEVVEGNGYEKCIPSRAFPILNFRSTNDNTVPYDGGPSSVVEGKPITFYSAYKTLEFWKNNNQCTGNAIVTGGPITGNKNTDGEGCMIYENCKDGTQAGLCVAKTDHSEGDATKAWNFLKKFKLP